MDSRLFWSIIAAVQHASAGAGGSDNDNDAKYVRLVNRLAQESEASILFFTQRFHALREQAYRADLWDAAAFINGRCCADHFDDFRAWLVTQGQRVYQNALRNPDTLAGVVTQQRTVLATTYESFIFAPMDAYEHKTGEPFPCQLRYDAVEPVPFGEFRDPADYPAAFPRLAARLQDCEAWAARWLERDYAR